MYEQITTHFTFRRFTSIARHSISVAIYEVFRILEGMSSLIETSIHPPSLVLSKRYGEVKPGIINWFVGNELPIFVSVTIRMPTFFFIYIYILMNRWTFTNETEILNLVELQ